MINVSPTTRRLTHGALIAALYILLNLVFEAISFGAVQFRVAEALTLLPVIMPEAVAGLTVGCLLGNIIGGAVWFDVVFGTFATLLAALAVRRLRNKPVLAAAMPVLFNGLIVGPVVYLGYVKAPGAAVSLPLMLSSMATVALGEAVVCYALGLGLLRLMRRLPHSEPK